jgi:hypothetical protein
MDRDHSILYRYEQRGGTVAGIANQRVMPVPTPHAENGVPGVMSSFVSTKRSVPIQFEVVSGRHTSSNGMAHEVADCGSHVVENVLLREAFSNAASAKSHQFPWIPLRTRPPGFHRQIQNTSRTET